MIYEDHLVDEFLCIPQHPIFFRNPYSALGYSMINHISQIEYELSRIQMPKMLGTPEINILKSIFVIGIRADLSERTLAPNEL